MHAVILAGGKGTRLRPLTDTRPKPLLPFVGAPFAAGLLRRLSAAGVTHATFLVGQDPTPFWPLETLGADLGVPVAVVTEREPLDTAGACRDLLRGRDDELALVCNGDILTDLDYAGLVTAHRAAGADVTIALTRVEDTTTFGVVETDAQGRILRFVEKPPAGTLVADTVNAGTYVLSPAAFEPFADPGPLSFERVVFPQLLERGAALLGVAGDDFWLDLGTPQRYLAGTAAVLEGRCHWPLDDEYLRLDDTVLAHRSAVVTGRVGPTVVVGPGATIGYGARVERTVLFEEAQVHAGATVTDSILAERAEVAAQARVHDAVAAAGAQLPA